MWKLLMPVMIGLVTGDKLTAVNDIYPLPLAHFKADGQDIYALVDTGATYLFVVWKHWYEEEFGVCANLVFGCYECVPPCTQGPTKAFTFGDGSKVWLFPHSGKLEFDSAIIPSANFGMVAGFNRDSERIWASLGLRASTPATQPYTSIVEQLVSKKVISSNSFSLYFKGGEDSTGELILGGEDPGKYVAPLKYVQIVNKDEQFVQLMGLAIGSDPKYRIPLTASAAFDTGASHIYINEKFKKQLIDFLQIAGQKKVSIQQERLKLLISCDDAKYLPSMTFSIKGLKGEAIPLEIPATSLVSKYNGGTCILRLAFVADDECVLGASAFMGKYFNFQLQSNKSSLSPGLSADVRTIVHSLCPTPEVEAEFSAVLDAHGLVST
ncbi:hypothetical protein FOZ62_023528, partial [Perkinsus olseni]